MRSLVRACVAGCAVLWLIIGASATAPATEDGQIGHIETTRDGTVRVLYSLPPGTTAAPEDLAGITVEVAGAEVDATASPVEAGEIERVAVLALDVSRSMQGSRFTAAKSAAEAYLEVAPDDVRVGLVTFAGEVEVVASPTADHDEVARALDSLELSTGTRLHDGVLEAIGQAGTDGQRQVVVLSDGADTGSTPLAQVVTEAKRSGTTVSVVSLEQSPANEAKLRRITGATSGSVLPANAPTALAALLTAEAEALAQQVLVEFSTEKAGEATVTVSLTTDGRSYSDSALVSLPSGAAPTESVAQDAPKPVEPARFTVGHELFLVGAGALGVGVAVILAILLIGRTSNKPTFAAQQLAHYSSGQETPSAPAQARQQRSLREAAVGVAHQVVKNGDLESRLTSRLAAAGVDLTAAEWLLLHAAAVLGGGLLGLLLSGGSIVAVLLMLFLGAAGPWIFLTLKRSRRLKAFNAQLADTLQLMSGALSAGLSLPQAVDTVVREGSDPIAGEFRRALVEQRLGVDIEDALDGVGVRMDSKDFRWVVMAIRIQREVGGNLAELLNTVANTLREREYLRRQVLSLSAEGRLSAWILGGLPPVFVGYLAMVRPEYLQPLLTTPIGWLMSLSACLMLGVGAMWLAKTVKVEV